MQTAQQANIILHLKTPIFSYVCGYESAKADIAIALIVQRRFAAHSSTSWIFLSSDSHIKSHYDDSDSVCSA